MLARWSKAALVAALLSPAGFALVAPGLVVVAAQERAMLLPVDAAPLVADTPAGPRRFTVEIADDDAERARGLMFRTEMPVDRGMLFVFEQTRPVGFWMKNTPMPLDLVFIGEDGRIIAILPGEPFSEASISPGRPARFVLELKRGTASAAGLAEGVRLRHPAIDAIAG